MQLDALRNLLLRDFSSATLYAAIFLILSDVLLACLHVLLNFGYLSDRAFHLEVPGGYAESIQYAKFAACILLMVYAFAKLGGRLRLIMASLFFFLLAEDAFEFHEQIHIYGQRLIELDGFVGLAPTHLWELIYGLLIGGGLLLLLAWSIYITDRVYLRQLAVSILALLILFGAFGLGVDAIHAIFQQRGNSIYVESGLGLLEEFGEMVSVSLIVALLVGDAVNKEGAAAGAQ